MPNGREDKPDYHFAHLREEMEASGKRYCVAYGDYYDATFKHYDDMRDAMEHFANISRGEPGFATCGIYEAHQKPITAVYVETEIPF